MSDTWRIVSGSISATYHVQNESNMSSNGTHERHVATCDRKEIHGRWIRNKGNPKVTNEKWTSGMRGQVLLTHVLTN